MFCSLYLCFFICFLTWNGYFSMKISVRNLNVNNQSYHHHHHHHNDTNDYYDISHFQPQTHEHVFVSGFFDLGGFRDTRQSYIDSIYKVFQSSQPMIFFCEEEVCDDIIEEAKVHNVYLIRSEFKASHVYLKYKTKTVEAIENIKAIGRTDSDLLNLGSGIVHYILINHLKFELIEKASKINPFNSSYITWIDAGIYRHSTMVEKYDPNNIHCYRTENCRLPTGNPFQPWPTLIKTVLLIGPRHEVAATVMTFNIQHYLTIFHQRYFDYLNEIYTKNLTSSEQGILTLYVQRYRSDVKFINSGYNQIAYKLLNINC